MKTVLLLNPPSRDVQVRDFYCSVTSKGNYRWAPIDLLVQSGRLHGRFELVVVDAIGEGLSRAAAMHRARAARPFAVLALTSSASFAEDVSFLEELKRANPCLVALSGNVAQDGEPWAMEGNRCVDALVSDFTTPALADWLEGRGGEALPGLAHREGERLLDGRRLPVDGALSYPTPRHELFTLASYRLPYARRYPVGTITTTYGCPFSCSYCVLGKPVLGYRARPLEDVVAELERLEALGVRELYFRDPLFGAHPRTRELLETLRDRFDFTWSCDSRVDTVDDEKLALMAAAGCGLIAFGIESASLETLARHEKPMKPDAARRAVEACRRHGVLSAGYFILGLPGEDAAACAATARFAVDLGLDYASFTAASPDYGTRLRKEAVAAGTAGDRLFDRNRAGASLSARLTDDELDKALRAAAWGFYGRPSYAARRLMHIRSPRQLWESMKAAAALARHYA